MKYDSEEIRHILLAIDRGINLDILCEMKFLPQDIGRIIDQCLNEGLISEIDGKEVLTEEGMKVLTQDVKFCRKKTSGLWIMPFHKYRIEKSDVFKVHLPKRNQLKWLGQTR